MLTFFGDRFQVQIEATFECDDPIFDSLEAALDCYHKAIEMILRWNHHDVKISLVQLVPGDEIVILHTVIE